MTNFGHCIHCRDPLDSPDFQSCGRCAQLLLELGDTVVDPPAREPGSDDVPKLRPIVNPRHDGRWLAWAAAKRGLMRWFHDYGHMCGFPRDIRQWSPCMVERAVQARLGKARNA